MVTDVVQPLPTQGLSSNITHPAPNPCMVQKEEESVSFSIPASLSPRESGQWAAGQVGQRAPSCKQERNAP